MNTPSLPIAVYYEIVRKPYFVIIHTQIRDGHERFDQYRSKPDGLIEFMLNVVEHLTQGRSETLDRMCHLDEHDEQISSHRTRRYISKESGTLYEPTEYKGYGFSTDADKAQAFAVVKLACRALEIPYKTVRKLEAFVK